MYNDKSDANKIYAKQRLFAFKMVEGKSIMSQLDLFKKMVAHHDNLEIDEKNRMRS